MASGSTAMLRRAAEPRLSRLYVFVRPARSILSNALNFRRSAIAALVWSVKRRKLRRRCPCPLYAATREKNNRKTFACGYRDEAGLAFCERGIARQHENQVPLKVVTCASTTNVHRRRRPPKFSQPAITF